MIRNYYDILKVTPQACDADIKQAYRALALSQHPDRNPHNRPFYESRFRLINEAYTALRTPEKRRQYNRRLQGLNDNDMKAGRESWLARIAGLFATSGTSRRDKA